MAIERLQGCLRGDPSSEMARGCLFGFSRFAGGFDRAGRLLVALAGDLNKSKFGVVFYRVALSAEREPQVYRRESASGAVVVAAGSELFARRDRQDSSEIYGSDFGLAGRMEFLAAGAYYRIAFRHLQWPEFDLPQCLRRIYWHIASAKRTQSMQSTEFESIVVPLPCPDSHLDPDDAACLGRAPERAKVRNGDEIPCGQRLLVIGGEEILLLAVRRIEFDSLVEGPGDGDV